MLSKKFSQGFVVAAAALLIVSGCSSDDPEPVETSVSPIPTAEPSESEPVASPTETEPVVSPTATPTKAPTATPASGPPCTNAAIAEGLGVPTKNVQNKYCEDGWAGAEFLENNEEDEAAGLLQAEGDAWVNDNRESCGTPQIPEYIQKRYCEVS